MEVKDKKLVAILESLEKIARLNQAILRHEKSDNPDRLAIAQFEGIKDDIAKDLITDLLKMDLKNQFEKYFRRVAA